MELNADEFIHALKGQSFEDLSASTLPYSSPNILSATSNLYQAAQARFGTTVVHEWTVLHWVIFRLMLLRDDLATLPSVEAGPLNRAREVFKTKVIGWFRTNQLPTHEIVSNLSDAWRKQKAIVT